MDVSDGAHRGRRHHPVRLQCPGAPVRFLAKHVLPLFGLSHSLPTGAKRIVDGLTDESFKSGVFYASRQNALTGPVVDQSTFFPDLANHAFQDHADEAIHRFL